jgi:hypothetical protein
MQKAASAAYHLAQSATSEAERKLQMADVMMWQERITAFNKEIASTVSKWNQSGTGIVEDGAIAELMIKSITEKKDGVLAGLQSRRLPADDVAVEIHAIYATAADYSGEAVKAYASKCVEEILVKVVDLHKKKRIDFGIPDISDELLGGTCPAPFAALCAAILTALYLPATAVLPAPDQCELPLGDEIINNKAFPQFDEARQIAFEGQTSSVTMSE